MEEFEYTYTGGMSDEAVGRRLREANTATLALAEGNEAYAIPVAIHYEEDAVYLRLAVQPGSTKRGFLAATDRACLLVYDDDPLEESWSVLVRGPIEPATEADRETIGDVETKFVPLRVFGEPIEDLEPRLFALRVETITGRTA
ncbi:pyridoxamine 5'-phosphate oxidase family protein [Natronorarus salvus]|uniref:pyridoxamine 5'-phosphate oxidase family protein n=1 Tax=Natronorarus salvus TaxID=3117733 RepID=UPI002F268CB7